MLTCKTRWTGHSDFDKLHESMVRRGLLYSTIYIFINVELIPYIKGGKVSCDFGYNFITREFPVQFTVTELPVEDGCFPGEFENGDTVWPGPPQKLNVTISYRNFSLSWKPPDDSSIQHITGFLVRLFVEDFSPVFSMDPDICLFVNFSQSQVPTTSLHGKFVQDSTVSVQCRLLLHPPLNVRVYLTSLPLPSAPRHYKEITQTIQFKDRPLEPTTRACIEDTDLEERGINESSIIAVAVVIVSVALIVGIIFTAHQTMKHHRNNEQNNATPNNAETAEHDLENHTDSLAADTGALPEKYSHIFMSINSES